jgi:hypothetical protein
LSLDLIGGKVVEGPHPFLGTEGAKRQQHQEHFHEPTLSILSGFWVADADLNVRGEFKSQREEPARYRWSDGRKQTLHVVQKPMSR